MKEKERRAFILDRDEFFRLSLSKILRKYGFEVEEVRDFRELEGRGREIRGGMVLADVEIDALEESFPLLKKWNDRIILMSPVISEDVALRLKRIGIQRIIKKPVEPRMLRKAIKGMTFPNGDRDSSSTKKKEGSRLNEKGGEDT